MLRSTANTHRHIVQSISLSAFLFFFVFAINAHAQVTVPTLGFEETNKQDVPLNTPFTTTLVLKNTEEQIGGVGAKILFDPDYLEVTNIETLPLFPDYPTAVYDNALGSVSISGVVQNISQLVTQSGAFAKITWTMKQTGSTQITYHYEPNSTKDSNIAVLYGNGDALQAVESLEISSTKQETINIPTETTIKSETPPSIDTNTLPSMSYSMIGLIVIILALTLGFHIHTAVQIHALKQEIVKLEKAFKNQ